MVPESPVFVNDGMKKPVTNRVRPAVTGTIDTPTRALIQVVQMIGLPFLLIGETIHGQAPPFGAGDCRKARRGSGKNWPNANTTSWGRFRG